MRSLVALVLLLFLVLPGNSWYPRGEEDDPRLEYEKCMQGCPKQPSGRQRQCTRKCEERYREQEERSREEERRGERDVFSSNSHREKEEEKGEERSTGNPYLFHEESLTERVKTEHGRVRVFERFSERSHLLKGIENYRVAVVEAKPRAFAVPSHWDADAILFITRGSGAAVLLRAQKKESINICRGDVIQVPAGTTFLIVNKDREETLQIAALLMPVNAPGTYRAYFGAGGRNPQTFYWSFSEEVLQAAFNTPWEKLKRMFEQRKEGAIIEASEEQIKEIVRRASSSSPEHYPWPFGGERQHFNLLKKRPSHSSDRGQIYEATPDECEELRDLNVGISYANLTSGSMTAPAYNSRATKVAVVVKGRGYAEMACPHLAHEQHRREQARKGREGEEKRRGREEEEEWPETYKGIRSQLSPNTVFVVPAGHPVVTVASGGEDLQVLCFELHARGNHRNYLAGKNMIYKNLENEEAELSFGVPAREVEQVFNAQKHEVILPGPEERGGKKTLLQWM